jgi:hypothetical protein
LTTETTNPRSTASETQAALMVPVPPMKSALVLRANLLWDGASRYLLNGATRFVF